MYAYRPQRPRTPCIGKRCWVARVIAQRRMLFLSLNKERSLAKVVLASALSRWLPSSSGMPTGEVALEVAGASIGEVLDRVFALHPNLRGYVVDEQGAVRHHVAVFVDGDAMRDKRNLAQPLGERAELYVMQALSGG